MHRNRTYIIGLCILSCFLYVNGNGESCFHNGLKKNGKCITIEDCSSAKKMLKKNIHPQSCGFIGTVPKVCCVEDTNDSEEEAYGRKSREKCKHFEGIVKNLNKDKCSVNKIINKSKRSIGVGNGDPAFPREFPHMVAIGYSTPNDTEAYFCAGSLISERFVLTAGHCLYSQSHGVPKFVRLGDHDEDDAKPVDIKISKLISHPDYRPPIKYNDIALLQLERNVTFNSYIYPICLKTKGMNWDDFATQATGWGNTNAWGDPSNILMKVELEFFPSENCSSYFKTEGKRLPTGISADSQICAGFLITRKDTCKGDSGGPLQQFSEHFCLYQLVGLTSFGKPCLLSDAPGVYTRIYPYVNWIENIVWP